MYPVSFPCGSLHEDYNLINFVNYQRVLIPLNGIYITNLDLFLLGVSPIKMATLQRGSPAPIKDSQINGILFPYLPVIFSFV